MKRALVLLCFCALAAIGHAQVPNLLNYQGRVAVGTVNFDGTGQFKFKLVNAAGTTAYWSNDGNTSNGGGEPATAVSLAVTKGLYSVMLGDTSLTNMAAIGTSQLNNKADVRLRVWFSDGVNGFQLLTPDQRIGASAYAVVAGGVNLPAGGRINQGTDWTLISDASRSHIGVGTNAGGIGGNENTAVGYQSLLSGGTGGGNTALGALSLRQNTNGNGNTGLGDYALNNNITGNENTGVGISALEWSTGSNNIAVGAYAGTAYTTTSNNIAIGHLGVVTDSGIIRIGTGGTHTATFIAGTINGNGSGLTNVSVPAGNVTGTITSSQIASGAVGTAQLANGLTLAGTTTGTFSGPLTGNVTGNVSGSAASFTGSLGGDVTGIQSNTSIASTVVTGKLLTGFSSAAGTLNAGDSILSAINKLDGNIVLKAPLASPTFTGTVAAPIFTTTGVVNLPTSSSASVGVINQNGVSLLHSFGTNNTFSGASAGNFAMTGSDNTGTGFHALLGNTTGHYNAGYGSTALSSNTSGRMNTAIGTASLYANTVGEINVAIGYSAMQKNVSGSYNTAIGTQALYWVTGSNNIAIGYNAGLSITSGSNNIDIGNEGVAGESNTIRIGTSGTHTATYIAGTINGNGSGLTNISATNFSGSLAGDVTGTQGATAIASSVVTGKVLTGFASTTGAISATDTILSAINKLNGNDGLKANIASPTFTGTVTAPTFIGVLNGNATGFTGSLSGDVTGPQSATVVGQVGGKTAAYVATGAQLATEATDANTASKIVKRDGNGDFTTRSITLAGALKLPVTTASTVGTIMQNGTPILHTYGSGNYFAGTGAGNFTMTGFNNTATGNSTLFFNTTGDSNTAHGLLALGLNTSGSGNTAVGLQALYSNTTGGANTATGKGALLANTTGAANSAFGTSALLSNVDGVYNTALGSQALQDNTSGDSNCAIGLQSVLRNTTGNDNVGLGFQALATNTTGSRNVAVGSAALYSNTTASDGTAVGVHALFSNTTGTANSAFGFYALSNNTTAGGNVAVGNQALFTQSYSNGGTLWNSDNLALGYQALYSNQPTATDNGTWNTALGTKALYGNTIGYYNTASGYVALTGNTSGRYNTAAGAGALQNSATGDSNTAVGFQSAQATTSASGLTAVGFQTLQAATGNDNTAFGYQALKSVTTGTGNIAIGSGAGAALTLSNSSNICIGNSGTVGDNGTIRVGSIAQSKAFVAGIRGVTTGSNNTQTVLIDNNGQLGTISSSRRYKEEITDMAEASARLLNLRPVTFRYKRAYEDGTKPVQFGLIAEEVAEAFPELTVFNDQGAPETVKYHDIVPMLLNEVQKDHRRADARDEEIAALKKRIAELEARDKARGEVERVREERLARLEEFMAVMPKVNATSSKVADAEDTPPTK